MKIVHVDDVSDHRLDDYRSLTDIALRRLHEPEGGLYMAEPAKVIARAVQAGHRPRPVLTQPKWLDAVEQALDGLDAAVHVAWHDIREPVRGCAIHPGPLAAMHRPPQGGRPDALRRAPLVLVLEDITDHPNVGAAFRAAAALGADAVLVSP